MHDPKYKYLQSFGRTKSRKLRDSGNRLLEEIFPAIKISEFPGFKFRPQELWLEIGFGDGGHLLHQALANQQVGFVGCEPFVNGMVKLLRGVEENKLENVRIFQGDFRELVTLEGWKNSIDRAFVLFPDPWPKKKQNKRRLISKETLDILSVIMKPGAKLRIATDHEDYAKWIAKELLAHDKFQWLAESKEDWQAQPADHVETKYQKKNLAKTKSAIFFESVCDKKLD